MKNKNKNIIDMGTKGTYQEKEQDIKKNNESITENNASTTPNRNNSFSLKSAFGSLRRKKSKNKEVPIYDVIDDSKMKRDSTKERLKLLTPVEEISDIDLVLKNILNKIYYHKKYPFIKDLSEYINSSTDPKEAYLITLKSIMKSLNIFEENQDLLNTALNKVLFLFEHNIWDEVLIKNNEVDYETTDGDYETIDGDYETIDGDYETINEVCYEIMKSCKKEEPDYINVKQSNYMDMNKGKPSFFVENTTNEKENEKAQQEELPVAPCSRLN